MVSSEPLLFPTSESEVRTPQLEKQQSENLSETQTTNTVQDRKITQRYLLTTVKCGGTGVG